MKKKDIVVIGGGTGTFVALSGLKNHNANLSAIISMADSGGSTGRLRDQLGVLPPGDLRQALVALSRSEQIWRDLFTYRFDNGDLEGHNFGNIFLSTLEKTTGSLEKSIALATKLLDAKGQVIPVTFDIIELCVQLQDGAFVIGETHIDEGINLKNRAKIKTAFLQPKPTVNKKAIKVIENADLIVLGPGDLYTSIIPNLLVKNVSYAIKKSKAKKVYVLNLMTKLGQTTNYTAQDHITDLEKYLGSGVLDFILVNNAKVSKESSLFYKKRGEKVVKDNLQNLTHFKIIRADLLSDNKIVKINGDKLIRSFIRHSSDKLATQLFNLLD